MSNFDRDFQAELAAVATASGIPAASIVAAGRTQVMHAARSIISHKMRERGYSYSSIGGALNRDHCSVLRNVAKPLAHWEAMLRRFLIRDAPMLAELTEYEDALPSFTDRAQYAAMVARLRDIPPERRGRAWERVARDIYPHSWSRQQLPRGL